MNFVGKTNPFHFTRAPRQWRFVLGQETLFRLIGFMDQLWIRGKNGTACQINWLIGRLASLSKESSSSFFQARFVAFNNLWREGGDHVPKHWFTERTKNVDEAYGITLFGLSGRLIKQSLSECDGFLYSDVLKRIMEAVNNVNVEEFGAASLPGAQAHAQTPKSQRIEVLERELVFYQEKVREIESSIVAASLETPPNTPGVSSQFVDSSGTLCSIDSIASSISLGPINKKRQLKSLCGKALEQISSASSHGTLGSILGYGFIYGREEHQQLAKSSISQAVEIVAEKKGI